MRALFVLLTLLTAGAGVGQLRKVQTRPDFADLYARVSESAYVVRGRLTALNPIVPRVPGETIAIGPNLWRLVPRMGGSLFTVEVEETVCRQTDFAVAPPPPVPLTNLVQIFVPLDAPKSVGSKFDPYRWNSREYLLQGREYLLFLSESPGQDELVSTYRLDSGVTYYRTYEGDRGAIPLPDEANPEGTYTFITPLVSAVTALCEAVKTDDVETKVRQLYALKKHSSDPAWLRSVDAAIKAFEKPPDSLPPQK